MPPLQPQWGLSSTALTPKYSDADHSDLYTFSREKINAVLVSLDIHGKDLRKKNSVPGARRGTAKCADGWSRSPSHGMQLSAKSLYSFSSPQLEPGKAIGWVRFSAPVQTLMLLLLLLLGHLYAFQISDVPAQWVGFHILIIFASCFLPFFCRFCFSFSVDVLSGCEPKRDQLFLTHFAHFKAQES